MCAALLTQTRSKAAPILTLAPRLPGEGIRALVVDSGNPDALTGRAGVEDVRAVNAGFAAALGVRAERVISTSTGVMSSTAGSLPRRQASSSGASRHRRRCRGGIEAAARAILTTDTRPKSPGAWVRLRSRRGHRGVRQEGWE